MKHKIISVIALALLPASWAVPQAANAYTHCVGNDCEVSYTYTGKSQVFTPPSNATNLRFEIYGAAGGRGGAGGVVTGTLTQIPQTMLIYVGGVGKMGANIPGGFNGGGSSGGNSGTEGTGGGASDIRLSHDLESRIVVAGGGGGGGGEAGGTGGHGGTEFAAHGGSGQASGGGGGSQTSGGFAGASNGGFLAATEGQLGLGGTGGSSTFTGGGGGGGGFYGGGGGGADDNTCCSDGGGGGGGSSYANPEYTTNIAHQAGVSWGHGWVVIRYTLVPAISNFELIQVSKDRAVFSIEATEALVGLEPDELVMTGEGCEISEFTLDGTLAYGAVTGCLGGEVSLMLKSQSFGSGLLGPVQNQSVKLNFDTAAPEFNFGSVFLHSSQSELVITYTVTDLLVLQPELFEVSGCEMSELRAAEIVLSNCQEGVGSLALLPNTLTDIWQNQGPAQSKSISFHIDQSAPVATWSEVVVSEKSPFRYSAVLSFSEPVSISNLALAFAASAECESGHEVLIDHLVVWASCGYSSVNWSFTALVSDALGNIVELCGLTVGFNYSAPAEQSPPLAPPAPEVIYVPIVVEVPAAIVEPIVESPSSSADLVTVPEPDPVPTSSGSDQVPLDTEGAENTLDQSAQTQPMIVTEQSEATAEVLPAEEQTEKLEAEILSGESAVENLEPEVAQIAQPVSGPDLVLENPSFPWLPVLLILSLGILGLGAWRFSGR